MNYFLGTVSVVLLFLLSSCGSSGGSTTTTTTTTTTQPTVSLSVSTSNIFEQFSRHTQLGTDQNGPDENAQFGSAVALSEDGSRYIASAVNFGNASGLVSVFDYEDGAWTKVGDDLVSEAAGDQFGISVAINDSGSTIIIGGRYNDGTANAAWHAQVYTLVWTQLGSDIDGEALADLFGHSVAISGDATTVAVGAVENDGTASNAGHVRAFRLVDGEWSQIGADIDGEAEADEFGTAVALSEDGTTLAVGANFNDGTGVNAGHVRVYSFADGTWTQIGSDIDGEAAGDQFGGSVDLSADGTVLAVGARFNDGSSSPDTGHVRVFERSGSTWTQIGSDINGEAEGDNSGAEVSLSADGNTVAISAPNNDGSASNAGHVRIYTLSNDEWILASADIDGESASDFGGNVSLSADGLRVAVGAANNDDAGTEAGHVRLHERTLLTSSATITATIDAASSSNVVATLSEAGTASGESVDYTLSSSTITITAGQTTGTATVTSVPDTTSDDEETIILDIASATAATVSSNPSTITIDEL